MEAFLYILQDAFADYNFVKIGFLHRSAGFKRGNSGQTGILIIIILIKHRLQTIGFKSMQYRIVPTTI